MPSEGKKSIELLQGTLDLIVLRALSTMGPQHSYALATRLEQVSEHPLSLNQGTPTGAGAARAEGTHRGAWDKTGEQPRREVLPHHEIRGAS
jgi:hypothetical protein